MSSYQVYQVTNEHNGRYYIGVHCGDIFKDNYYGSGPLIKKALKKYGKSSFSRSVIATFGNVDLACYLEKILVPEEIAKDRFCYNITEGGGLPPLIVGDDHGMTRIKKRDRELIKRLYLFGKTSHWLAQKYKTSPGHICNILRKEGAKIRPSSSYKKPTKENHHRWKKKDESGIINKYTSGLSTYEIAEQTGLTDVTISSILKKNNIEMRGAKDYTSMSVVQKKKCGEIVAIFKSQKEAAKFMGVTPSAICDCINGRRRYSRGFIWEKYLRSK